MNGFNKDLAPEDHRRLNLFDAFRILLVWVYWYLVRYFSRVGIHDGHHAVLAYSFLDVASWFSGVFRQPPFNSKQRQRYDDRVARTSACNDLTGMGYLLGMPEGVQG